jgi:hypothetical protein
MSIKRIIIWNNPAWGLEYRADVDIDTGKVFYKTNAIPNNLTAKNMVRGINASGCGELTHLMSSFTISSKMFST